MRLLTWVLTGSVAIGFAIAGDWVSGLLVLLMRASYDIVSAMDEESNG